MLRLKRTLALLLGIILALFCGMNVFSHQMSAEYVTPSFENLHETSFGLCEVYSYGKYFLYTADGRLLKQSDFPIKIMNNGLILEVNEAGMARFLNIKNGKHTDFVYDAYPRTNPKTTAADYPYLSTSGKGDGSSRLIPFSKNNKFGFISDTLEEVIPARYDYAYGFYDGMARICTGGILSEYGTYTNCSYGYINEKGEEILPPDSYWIAEDYKDGYARVSNNGSMYYLVDKNGTRLDFGDASVAWYKNGHVALTRDGLYALCDMSGRTIISYGNSEIRPLGNNFIVGNSIIDPNGNTLYTVSVSETLVPFDYAQERGLVCALIRKPIENNRFFNHTGLVGENGKIILDTAYTSISVLGEGIIFAVSDLGNFVYDYDGNMLFEISASSPERSINGAFSALDNNTGERVYVKNPVFRKAPDPDRSLEIFAKDGFRIGPFLNTPECFGATAVTYTSLSSPPYAEKSSLYICAFDKEALSKMTLTYKGATILIPATVVVDLLAFDSEIVAESFGK